MCLAVPGKVIEIFEEAGLVMGNVDHAGMITKVCLAFVPDIRIGDYTVVHAGYGISVIDEEEAQKSYDVGEEILSSNKDNEVDSAADTESLLFIRSLKKSTSKR
jgi:hydrogenase expression/formation protein HypC